MIKVRFKRTEDDWYTVKITGHALSAIKGKDLVCAAASAYAIQLCQLAQMMKEAEYLEADPEIYAREGHCQVKVKPKKEMEGTVVNLLTVVEAGFQYLSEAYKQYVKLTVE